MKTAGRLLPILLMAALALSLGCEEPSRAGAGQGGYGGDGGEGEGERGKQGDGGRSGPDDDTGGFGRPDAGGDPRPPDAGETPDAGDPPGPSEVAPFVEPVPFQPEEWLVGQVRDPNFDPVFEALEGGGFRYPEAGRDRNGIQWRPVLPDDAGAFSGLSGPIVYIVARFDLEAGQRLFARADRLRAVWGNGRRLPGDFYGHGRSRIPLTTEPWDNVIVAQAYLGRGDPSLGLWTTPDEIHFNFADVTVPDLRVGDDSELPIGVTLTHLTEDAALDLRASVVESDLFEATTLTYPGIPGGATTQVGFLLKPKAAWSEPEVEVAFTLRVESKIHQFIYEREMKLTTISAEAAYRRTFISPVDASVQYYGVLPPSDFDPEREYGLVLSLHGAGVDAIGQARAYSKKNWAYVIAPTNRRPFGFDWEEWGHLNGLAALAHAKSIFRIDPTRVHVTGHSMGGHGTWQFGVHHPGLFAVVGPSAGWSSFYTYTGASRPSGTIARARAHSDTNRYLENLAQRAVYIIHGSDDDNVPVREGRDLFDEVRRITEDAHYHEQEGAGHWWDGDAAPGADCVDWPELFDLMEERRLDPLELDFEFKSPYPAYSPTHSYATVLSVTSPMIDTTLESALVDGRLELETSNVRSIEIDGASLRAKGHELILVDDEEHELPDGPLRIGPEGGKGAGLGGPFNQVFHRPHCYVYPDSGGGALSEFAAYMATFWQIIGNGHSCALPVSAVTPEIEAGWNLIWLSVPPEVAGAPTEDFDWTEDDTTFLGRTYGNAAMFFLFPRNGRLNAVMHAPAGREHLLYGVVPFSSRSGLPDYLVWNDDGGIALGFFDGEWQHERRYGQP